MTTFIYTALLTAAFSLRKSPPGKAYLIMIALSMLWTVGFIFETAALGLELKLFLARIQYISICFLPIAWVYLATSYLGIQIRRKYILALSIIPAVTLLIIWLVPTPNWFWGSPQILYTQAPFPVIDYDYKWWFYGVLIPYGYVLFFSASAMLAHGLFRFHQVYRRQILLLLAAILLPLATNLLYNLGISPVPHYNYTTAVLSISGLISAWSLFRYKFLDLTPTARNTVIEQMDDGVIVLDMKHRVVDINPSARKITGQPGSLVGVHAMELQEGKIWQAIEELSSSDISRAQVDVRNPEQTIYDVKLSYVHDAGRNRTGMIINLRDTTERVLLFEKVQILAAMDSLTGLHNRRHLIELGSKYLKDRSPVSLIMFDVDKFKVINDTYGHEAGDTVLISISEYCRNLTEKPHLAGRIGGDEFALILPDTELFTALPLAVRLNHGIQALKIPIPNRTITATVSVGVSSSSLLEKDAYDLAQLLSLADRAMYQAKVRGRNQVISAKILVR